MHMVDNISDYVWKYKSDIGVQVEKQSIEKIEEFQNIKQEEVPTFWTLEDHILTVITNEIWKIDNYIGLVRG